MIPIPTGVRVWLATGYTDMRKGFPGLSLQVQEVLRRDPLGGHLFCFRGRRSDLLKVIWHDGQGACLFTNTLHTTPPSASVEDFSTIFVLRVAARSTRRFHRLHCLRGRFDAGISYR